MKMCLYGVNKVYATCIVIKILVSYKKKENLTFVVANRDIIMFVLAINFFFFKLMIFVSLYILFRSKTRKFVRKLLVIKKLFSLSM